MKVTSSARGQTYGMYREAHCVHELTELLLALRVVHDCFPLVEVCPHKGIHVALEVRTYPQRII